MGQTEREHGTETVSVSTLPIRPHTWLSDLEEFGPLSAKQPANISQHMKAETPPAQTNVPLTTEYRISPTDNS